MRWQTNFYDFRFKGTATAAIGIHPSKAWLSQLVNFKNAIWTLEEQYVIKFYMHWVLTGQTVNKEYYFEVLREFRKRFRRKRPALFKSGQRHFHQDNTPVHNSILVTDYLTKMGIKTVPHSPYSPDIAPCDFCLFPKTRGCCYETIKEMKEAVTKVIDTLTQEDFHGAFQKLLER